MILVVALADRVQVRDVGDLVLRRADDESAVGTLLVIAPEAPHRIVDRGKDFHRRRPRIDPLELLVDVENSAELAVELHHGAAAV